MSATAPHRAESGHAARGRHGFTLIEILSVVAILALVAAFVVPNFGAIRARALRAEAQKLASQLELGRQRAIMTGIPHRLAIDLDAVTYRLEWLATESPESGAAPVAEPTELDLRGNTPLPLAAPRGEEPEFRPVPGMFGRDHVLDHPLVFGGLETPSGRIDAGQSHIEFERDGTAAYTEIYIDDAEGASIRLDVYPLDEIVRIRDATL